MSIYGTLWTLRFPRFGDDHYGCNWIDVLAQGVPEHIGRDGGDAFAEFLPSTGWEEASETESRLRAVVFVTSETQKGTDKHAQMYVDPLLVLSGAEYRLVPFAVLHARLCSALRAGRPRCTGEMHVGDKVRLFFQDGSTVDVKRDAAESPRAAADAGGRSRPWWRFW